MFAKPIDYVISARLFTSLACAIWVAVDNYPSGPFMSPMMALRWTRSRLEKLSRALLRAMRRSLAMVCPSSSA